MKPIPALDLAESMDRSRSRVFARSLPPDLEPAAEPRRLLSGSDGMPVLELVLRGTAAVKGVSLTLHMVS